MKRFVYSILFLMCCCTSVVHGIESCAYDSEENTISNPEICDQSSKCPRDKHPVGEDCPHAPG